MSINNIKDYYYILGLSRNASGDEIKKAYRKLSLKFHPDQNNGDKFFEGRFRDVNEAYETLSNDIKRKLYDDKLNGINNTGTTEKNYSNTNSSQSEQPKKQQPHKPANTPPPKSPSSSTPQKPKSNKAVYTLITILLFVSPFVIRIAIAKLKDDNSKNYDTSQYKTTQNSSHDTTAASIIKNTDSTHSHTPTPVNSAAAPALPDSSVSATIPQNDSSQSAGFKDEDGLTAIDALKYFLQALNNNDCNTAWIMAYNTTWESNGKDWFCSSAAFGGVRKVSIRNIFPLTQNPAEAEIYIDYYAEDIYNGNKCFKQTITVQKIAYTDKTRWKVTKMRNDEEPVVCDGN